MNLGLAIFLSALFLGFIWLYALNRDKLSSEKFSSNKKIKLVKKIIIILSVLSVIIIGAIYSFQYYNEYKKQKHYEEIKKQKEIQNELINKQSKKAVEIIFGLKLGDLRNDIIFKKGKPTFDKKDVLIYQWRTEYGTIKKISIILRKDSVIAIINSRADDLKLNSRDVLMDWTSRSYLILRLGEPNKIISSNDKLSRIYFYKEFQNLYFLQKDRVFAYGILDFKYIGLLEDRLFSFL